MSGSDRARLKTVERSQPSSRIEAINILGVTRTLNAERLRARGWTARGIADQMGVEKCVIDILLKGK